MPSTQSPPYPDTPLTRALLGPPGQSVIIEYGPPANVAPRRVVAVIAAVLNPDGSPAEDDTPTWLIVDLLEPMAGREARWRRTGRTSPIRWGEVRTIEHGASIGPVVVPGSAPQPNDPHAVLTVEMLGDAKPYGQYVAVMRKHDPDNQFADRVRAVGRLTEVTRHPHGERRTHQLRLTDLVPEVGTEQARHAAHDHLDHTLDVEIDDEIRVYSPV